MKRWNRKGTSSANMRMAELRLRKKHLRRNELSEQYRERFGHEWWPAAKAVVTSANEPMDPIARVSEHINWLMAALTPPRAA